MRNQEEMTLSAALLVTPAAGRVEEPPTLPPSSHLDAVNIRRAYDEAQGQDATRVHQAHPKRRKDEGEPSKSAKSKGKQRASPLPLRPAGSARRTLQESSDSDHLSPISVGKAATRIGATISPETSLPRTRSALSAVRALLHVRGSRPWMRSSSPSPRSVQAREYYRPLSHQHRS